MKKITIKELSEPVVYFVTKQKDREIIKKLLEKNNIRYYKTNDATKLAVDTEVSIECSINYEDISEEDMLKMSKNVYDNIDLEESVKSLM